MTKPLIVVSVCAASVAVVSCMSNLLPWGQMMFWGAQMLGSLFGATAGGQP